ncbi:MAG TPA: type II toxin-antitoxin system Phd/YefM family antitoxin [Polyangiaceae bacterium]|nr:type II toxin-antitoxin system Phd/YefM family antitoxin [Polyangiaceae bacterium]
MPRQVNIHAAKTHLSKLVDDAAAGEEIIIARGGKPVARLVAIARRGRRKPGLLKGRIRIARDFDAPLAMELIEQFAKPIEPSSDA